MRRETSSVILSLLTCVRARRAPWAVARAHARAAVVPNGMQRTRFAGAARRVVVERLECRATY
jgi:hypothetical protein